MERQMLRASLEKLKQNGNLLICDVEVDPEYELGAVLKYYSNTRPMLFSKVKGYRIPVVGAMFGDRNIYYNMLNLTHSDRIYRIIDAIANPKPTRLLNTGPVKENIITRNIDLPRMFPIPTFHEKDSSSFITAGIVVIKDPETNKRYTAVRRLQVNGGNRLSILVASPKLKDQLLNLENQNKPLEVAVILGYDYEFLLASQVSSQFFGVDKYEIDSALRGEPLELVKCHSVDLEVPAYAEIVLEGIIPPKKREIEGPFGELMGYYGGANSHPIIEITAVMHRNNPIFQVSFPCREEHLSNGLIREVELYTSLSKLVDVKDVNVTIGGGYRFHAVVSINKKKEGDGKSAILAALGCNNDFKHVIVVDDDVDIFNTSEVEGILATRVQASKDLVIISGANGSVLDPSHNYKGTTDKIGIDATKPLEKKGVDFEKAKIPRYENIEITKYFPNIK
ncbi:ubiquinone biosynthesis protein UbiD [Caloranaerobacter sp. TR13]|uniref:UbiD family decarboxylase n=1 Tax=Caloranaerobacter sp. TR13 TaxID=1302151 RepID=UPI0006D40737|nr:UbiD family decarboxylase [Caloranaerobacter sp. TR13]KPU26733.1 ubiquinone biosynthesis protein UbiD [Caloranaerobacter sp. TR13]